MSGNPKGRPKGSKKLSTLVTRALDEKVTVTENGKRRRRAVREVIISRLASKSAAGELKAMAMLLALAAQMEAREAGTPPEGQSGPGPDEQEVLKAFMARLRDERTL